MSEINEIAKDTFALSDLVVADERVSWVPPGASGFGVHHEYLLRTADTALLIDTGLAVHGASVLASLRELIGRRALLIFNTRSEPDCLGNLPQIMETFPDAGILTTSPLNPAKIVHLRSGRAFDTISTTRLKFGDTLASHGFPQLKLVDRVIRLLGTAWLLDQTTATLFSSDFFSAELLRSSDTPVVRRSSENGPRHDELCAGIITKFAWLERAERPPLEEHWGRFFGALKLEALAPTYGRIVAGGPVVSRTIEDYRRATFALTR